MQSVKHALMELVERHGEEEIVLNVLGYSLGSAVALSLVSDIAESIYNDLLKVSSSSSSPSPFSASSPRPPPSSSCPSFVARDEKGRRIRRRKRVIPTATKILSEQMRQVSSWQGLCGVDPKKKKKEENKNLSNGQKETTENRKGKIHSNVSFDPEKNLTFRDTCHLILYEDEHKSPCVSKLDTSCYSDSQSGGPRLPCSASSSSSSSAEEEEEVEDEEQPRGLKLTVRPRSKSRARRRGDAETASRLSLAHKRQSENRQTDHPDRKKPGGVFGHLALSSASVWGRLDHLSL